MFALVVCNTCGAPITLEAMSANEKDRHAIFKVVNHANYKEYSVGSAEKKKKKQKKEMDSTSQGVENNLTNVFGGDRQFSPEDRRILVIMGSIIISFVVVSTSGLCLWCWFQ